MTRMMSTLRGDLHKFIILFQRILCIRNVSDTSCRGNQYTHFIVNNFFSENHAIYEVKGENMVER
jgi:hypothetical protein